MPDTGTATVTIVDDETLQVVSVAASSTPTGGYYDAGDAITFKVTFTAPVTVTGAPQFAFDPGGPTRQAAYASGSDSKELVAMSVPDKSAFTVKTTPAGGSEEMVALAASNAVSISGDTLTLKLATPIAHNDTGATVSYTEPTSGSMLEDEVGNDVMSFTDVDLTVLSTKPRVSIEAVHTDASSWIANPVLRITRSTGTANLPVSYSWTQDDEYVAGTSSGFQIDAGNTTEEFFLVLDYRGSTDGDIVFTLDESTEYALAPDRSATVAFKAPVAGKPLAVVHDQADWTVDEGDNAHLTMTLTLADGLADPRDNFNLFIDLEGVTANARHGGDPGDFIVPVSGAQAPVLANRWTARSGGGVHSDRDARGRDRRGH